MIFVQKNILCTYSQSAPSFIKRKAATKVCTWCEWHVNICNQLKKIVSIHSRQNSTMWDQMICLVLQGVFWRQAYFCHCDRYCFRNTARIQGTLSKLNVFKLFPMALSLIYFIFRTNDIYDVAFKVALQYLYLSVLPLLQNILDIFVTTK